MIDTMEWTLVPGTMTITAARYATEEGGGFRLTDAEAYQWPAPTSGLSPLASWKLPTWWSDEATKIYCRSYDD